MDFLRVPALREGACGCLFEVVNKGMDDNARVRLVASLRIVEVVRSLKLDFSVEADIGEWTSVACVSMSVAKRAPCASHAVPVAGEPDCLGWGGEGGSL
jgi:hypothetical protein